MHEVSSVSATEEELGGCGRDVGRNCRGTTTGRAESILGCEVVVDE